MDNCRNVLNSISVILSLDEKEILEVANQLRPLKCPKCGSMNFVKIGAFKRQTMTRV